MKCLEKQKSKQKLKQIICCICMCIVTIVCGIFVIEKYINMNKKRQDTVNMKRVDTSTLIRYKGESYIAVPEDMIEENEMYIRLIKKYKLPFQIDLTYIDKVAEKLDNGGCLYTIKSVADDILILKDYNNDYCYAIKK